jgi:hypothetical protein
VLLLAAEGTTAKQAVVGLIVLALLAGLVGFLILGESRRAQLRRGSRRAALLAPAGFLVVVLVQIVALELGRPVAIALFVAVVAVSALVALRARQREEDRPAPPPAIEELPERYRFRDGGGSIAGWGLPLVIVLVGGTAFEGQLAAGLTLGLAALAAAIGLTLVFRRRRRRQRAIVADVERRAAELPREDLRKLVELLEVEHGRFEMRRLRRLLA